jgi:hypothetical protein
VRLLLDTHTFLWLMAQPDKLSAAAIAACDDLGNDLILSVASHRHPPRPTHCPYTGNWLQMNSMNAGWCSSLAASARCSAGSTCPGSLIRSLLIPSSPIALDMST